MDGICGAALRKTVQGRAPATADGGNILAEQTEAGKRLLGKAKTELPFGGGELFPYSKPPGEPCPTRMLCRTAVVKGLPRRETRPVAAKGPRRPKRRSRGLVIAAARTPRSTEMWPTRLI